jgi:hypothetical protein
MGPISRFLYCRELSFPADRRRGHDPDQPSAGFRGHFPAKRRRFKLKKDR